MGRQLQNFSFDERRCAELALEVGRLSEAILDAGSRFDFNLEPADFRGFSKVKQMSTDLALMDLG